MLPTPNEVVVQVATFAVMVFAEHPVIEVLPAMKLTVPPAPDVTVAVKVTDVPTEKLVELDVRVTVEAVPGRTATRGVERGLYPAEFTAWIET
jgi:hypothetical protein